VSERFGAGAGATLVRAWFERDHGGRSARMASSRGERLDFGVRPAAAPVVALRDHGSVPVEDHASHHRVRFGAAMSSRREADGAVERRAQGSGRHVRAPLRLVRGTGRSSPVTPE
jgi:hypothetical protein